MIDWGVVAAWVASIAAIVTVVITLMGLKKQMQLNFFSDYTKRYQEIILNFPESINQKDFDFNILPKEERDKTLRYMRAYFDLCSEEYFLHKKKHIDEEMWGQWESGIKFAFSKTAFKKAWQILRTDTIYDGEFTKFVNDSIPNNELQH